MAVCFSTIQEHICLDIACDNHPISRLTIVPVILSSPPSIILTDTLQLKYHQLPLLLQLSSLKWY